MFSSSFVRLRKLAVHAMRFDMSGAYPGACEICSGYWLTYAPDARAVSIGESKEFLAEVRRCRSCGAYWEVGAFSYPKVLTPEQALRELPDLESLEAGLGIDFPNPPTP